MITFNSDPCQAFPTLQLIKQETIQRLWSGYGEIARYFSKALNKNLIVKQVMPPTIKDHPRGWNTPLSHQRKIRSYDIELAFYRDFSDLCNEHCRVPQLVDFAQDGENFVLLLEDIDTAGFSLRKTALTISEIKAGLSWLASFHALFLQENRFMQKPLVNKESLAKREPSAHEVPSVQLKTEKCNHAYKVLWPIACYWHLDTRPDELEAMPEGSLKTYASKIDSALNQAKYQTLVHGDAKLANFCFHDQNGTVAALDFQYVGGGVGIKDVMMFLGSCMSSEQLFEYEQMLLSHYFYQLEKGLTKKTKTEQSITEHQLAVQQAAIDFKLLKAEWLALYPFAWADFHRFLAGWKPNHFKINAYMNLQTKKCLQILSD